MSQKLDYNICEHQHEYSLHIKPCCLDSVELMYVLTMLTFNYVPQSRSHLSE